MKRWRLDSIAMTIGLTIVVAMSLGFTLQHVVRTGLVDIGLAPHTDPLDSGIYFYAALFPAEIVALVQVLDAVPNAERPGIIAAVQRPEVRVSLRDAPLSHLVNSADPNARALRFRLHILSSVPHLAIVALTPAQTADPPAGAAAKPAGMVVEALLQDRHWLLFTTDIAPPPPLDPVAAQYSRASLGAWLALAAGLVVMLSLLAARRLARPLSELAVAVEHLGASGDAPLLPPKGPREIRITTDAFNRMQERLRRFNDDRVQMLAAMSHDLRTSLTRLKLRLEIGEHPEQQQKMSSEIDAMSAMIDSILSFARDDAKREPRTLVELDALVDSICEDASDAGTPVSYAGSRGVTVAGRPMALRRAVSNLVDNAVKYGGGGAEVTLTCEAGRVVVAVEDRGPGIPRSEREKVFEPFYRIEGSRNPDTGGVGLGLAVARSIAREHGGDIVLAARKGGGLSARLELPA
jgi:signal transduction histidine kinase